MSMFAGLSIIDVIIVGVYLLGILGIGMWVSRNLTNMKDFSVGGRMFSTPIIFATLSASFIGGGFSFGNAEKVFASGIFYFMALWGFSLKEMLVAKFIAPRIDAFPEAISVGDIIETKYGSSAKVLTGLFSVILCAGILGAQVGGVGVIFESFLGIDRVIGIIIGLTIVIIYSTMGGMKAVVFTDVVQFIVLAIGIPLTLILGVLHVGGVEKLIKAVPAAHFSFSGMQMSWVAYASLVLTFLLGETLVPPYVQRLLIAKDKKSRINGTFYSGLFSIPFFAISGGIGLVAMAINPEMPQDLAMPNVIRDVLPIGMKGIVIAGIVSIMMSSADSFLNAAAVSLTHDVIKPLRKTPLGERDELAFARITTLLTGVLAVVFALSTQSLLDILVYSYNFWSPVILVPLIAAVWNVKADAKAFFIGAVGGIAAVCIWNFALGNPAGIDGLIVGIVANLLFFTAAVLLGKQAPVTQSGPLENEAVE